MAKNLMTDADDKTSTSPESEPVAAASDALTPAELIDRHQRGVWRYLRMLGCDEATADDLTQETFLRVLRRDNFVQHNDSATAGYLRRTAYNLMVSRHRKTKRVHTVSDSLVLDEAWDRWAGKDLSGDAAVEALQACLQTLTERARTIALGHGDRTGAIGLANAIRRSCKSRGNRRCVGDQRPRCPKLNAKSKTTITPVCRRKTAPGRFELSHD